MRPVFLFDMGIVIFLVRSSARERDLMLMAITHQMGIDKFTAIIRINGAQGKREYTQLLALGAGGPKIISVAVLQSLQERLLELDYSPWYLCRSPGHDQARKSRMGYVAR